MSNIRRWAPALVLATCALPACAEPLHTPRPATVQPGRKPVRIASHADAANDDMPEPASLALLGLGVLGLIAFRRKV